MSVQTQQPQAVEIDGRNLYYRPLNEQVRAAVAGGAGLIRLKNICGQRYIGTGLRKAVKIEIHGTPGNDLAIFMDGPTLIVHGNAQDGVGNTMNSGEVIVHGSAGDLLAHSFRGGRIFVRDGAGYRVAIHMKQYTEPVPAVVVGGTVGDYAGEYMAGGVLVILGLRRKGDQPLTGRYLGTGMHGGVIYLRGDVPDDSLGREISRMPMAEADVQKLVQHVGRFAAHFGLEAAGLLAGPFTKLIATSARPYGRLYVY